jgi:hypothetical protein
MIIKLVFEVNFEGGNSWFVEAQGRRTQVFRWAAGNIVVHFIPKVGRKESTDLKP